LESEEGENDAENWAAMQWIGLGRCYVCGINGLPLLREAATERSYREVLY